ncbi:MAG: 16S rRNA (cytosine(1402)-N(4))-methyltransferase RsmH [Candidatus Magasanikbacteria bacterium]|nr:16S rRNA (cytosine(1402)-N(4))-methyltransferase RsmH [Candidatus Magasanikbacteria bacterium]
MRHVPVLLNEVADSLQLKPGMKVIDCTVGDAGHAEKILEIIGADGRLLAIDADPESLLRAKKFLYKFGGQVTFARGNFGDLREIAVRENFFPVHAVLFDLGWSSPQFAERGRGFSFQNDEPLDMRYGGRSDKSAPTAADILNQRSIEELERIFREYGEERLAREIALATVTQRTVGPLERTSQLVKIIVEVYRNKLRSKKEVPWVGGLHPATKVFQALRLAVNDELAVLERALPQAIEVLAIGGRLAVITFHSGEDRLVKHYFKSIIGKNLTLPIKKPITCQASESATNPRARSAKLRVAEKI